MLCLVAIPRSWRPMRWPCAVPRPWSRRSRRLNSCAWNWASPETYCFSSRHGPRLVTDPKELNLSRLKDLLTGCVLGAALTAAIAVFAAGQITDPLKLSPQYYTLRIDNPSVRVYEYRLDPGQKEVMHTHLPGVVFSLSDAHLKVTMP